MSPRTDAGRRMLRMFATEEVRRVRWPRVFDARLTERIAEEFIPVIEAEAREDAGPTIRMGGRVFFEWADGESWGRVVGIGGNGSGEYTFTVEREGPKP